MAEPPVPSAWLNPDTSVSVIMPVLNEEQYLAAAVQSVLAQEHTGEIEVVLGLGPSKDTTNEVARDLAASDSRIRLVTNPTGETAEALNLAIAASTNPIIIRVDAHGELAPGYIAHAVSELSRTGADNVGGVMSAAGETSWEKATALAMTSKIGVGNAAYHVGGLAGPSASVYLGCFRRTALERVGGFDVRFKRAQDWELNHRLRSTGGLVWFTPELQVKYRPRSNIWALAKQYFQYGTWRRAVMRSYPETKSLRFLAAPALVVSLVVAALLLLAGVWFRPLAWVGGGLLLAYFGCELVAGWFISRKNSWLVRFFTPFALMTMHLAWGTGFLTSRLRLSRES